MEKIERLRSPLTQSVSHSLLLRTLPPSLSLSQSHRSRQQNSSSSSHLLLLPRRNDDGEEVKKSKSSSFGQRCLFHFHPPFSSLSEILFLFSFFLSFFAMFMRNCLFSAHPSAILLPLPPSPLKMPLRLPCNFQQGRERGGRRVVGPQLGGEGRWREA